MTADRDGRLILPYDQVVCVGGTYMDIKHGDRRYVWAVDGDNIILNNSYSPIGTSPFAARNFRLTKEKDKLMGNKTLHIAVRIVEGESYEDLARMIAARNVLMIADTSGDVIRERVRQIIIANPGDKWLILTGTVIGEVSQPPIRFRQI